MNFTYTPNKIALYHSDSNLLAEVTFPDVDDKTVNINHTFVDDSLRGQGHRKPADESGCRSSAFGRKKKQS